MTKYHIKDLEKLSGVKAHTIRMWEQRYNLLQPFRTETNIRYYDDKQLKILLNVTSLVRNGYKISKVSKFSHEEISNLIQSIELGKTPGDHRSEVFINNLILAGFSYNELAFESAFSSALMHYGVRDIYLNVIYPMMQRIGVLWTTDYFNPAQEHFISNMLKRKFYMAIESLPYPAEECDKWLLFLPEDEGHEGGLLFAHYLLRKHANRVFYLGAFVPLESLESAVSVIKPRFMLCFLVRSSIKNSIQEYLDQLADKFPDQEILVSARYYQTTDLKVKENIHFVYSVEEFEKYM